MRLAFQCRSAIFRATTVDTIDSESVALSLFADLVFNHEGLQEFVSRYCSPQGGHLELGVVLRMIGTPQQHGPFHGQTLECIPDLLL